MRKRETTKREGSEKFKTKKSLGQHFLNNTRVPALMADAAAVKNGDVVLEIGPGTGVLTQELLSRGAKVVALEADSRAITVLESAYKDDITRKNLVLFHTDVRTLDLATLRDYISPHAYKVVANIPYYLSGYLFRTFLESGLQPSDLVFLVQKEVADRIARDKKESLLSLSVKVYGEPRYIKTVPKGNFTPPPKIDSAIIGICDISRKRFDSITEKDFFAIIHAGFASRRKQLLGNLSALYPRDVLVHIFSTLGIREDVRGEDLSLPTWLALVRELSVHMKETSS